MSSTGRGTKREPNDNYPTPGWCVRRLLEAWRPLEPAVLVEPCCGDGAIIRQMRRAGWHWISYDVREIEAVAERHRRCDFLTVATPGPTVKAVITNPPYSLAEQFIRHSRRLYPNAELVFLLRLAFLASADRIPLWLDVGTPDVYVLPNRPDFTGGGGDSTDYGWFRFDHRRGRPGRGEIMVLRETPIAERKADRPPKQTACARPRNV
jgi:hypothetical protein